MACPDFFLRTDGLTGADTGGTWALESGTYPGSLAGDNPEIVIEDLGFGSNVFKYRYSTVDCPEVESTVVLFRPNLGSGDDSTYTACDNATALTLITLIDNFVAGANATYEWSGDGTSSPGYFVGTSYNNSTFDPSVAGVGTYNFVLTVSPAVPLGFNLLACCEPFDITLEITVEESFDPGVGGNIVVC
jgi:hypothetical protein